jgi:hypothetical protein
VETPSKFTHYAVFVANTISDFFVAPESVNSNDISNGEASAIIGEPVATAVDGFKAARLPLIFGALSIDRAHLPYEKAWARSDGLRAEGSALEDAESAASEINGTSASDCSIHLIIADLFR